MAQLSTNDYWGSSEVPQIPMLGEYYPGGLNIAACVIASGSTAGVPTATSDGAADFMIDTVCEIDIFNIEGGSDTDADAGGVFIVSAIPIVVTAFTATVNIQLGDCNDSDGWAAEAAIGATSTDYGITNGADTSDFTYNHLGGVYYGSSSGNMKLVVDTADPAAGRLDVYVQYFVCRRTGTCN